MTTEKKETEIKEEDGQKLDKEQIGEVNGAGSPFEDIPRVPLKPIDDKLRKNG